MPEKATVLSALTPPTTAPLAVAVDAISRTTRVFAPVRWASTAKYLGPVGGGIHISSSQTPTHVNSELRYRLTARNTVSTESKVMVLTSFAKSIILESTDLRSPEEPEISMRLGKSMLPPRERS
ncbi:hypothetical protein RRF57_009513 [Xylaria bambusicola]|uniref:Uncharacterized protein n=1 Tax=Xylaria bambusicola TaxID=326684 RepID=A0AAN7Z1Q0_9PEZI